MADEMRPPKGPWRIAQNEWNLQSPPWSGAIAIEDMSEPWLAVPGIVCYLTRGFGQEAAAALIAAAPEMADHVAVLTAEITRLRTELAALRPAPRAHNLGVPPIADSSAQHYVKLSKMFAEAEVTIERLRIENAALRTERDYERARFAELPPSPPYPRAHDLGMGQREPAWVTLGSDAPAPIAGMVAAALAPGPLPATHAAALPAKAMR